MSEATLREAHCDICNTDFDSAEELFTHDCEETLADGGHVSTREPGDAPELDHLNAAADHIFQANAAYQAGADEKGDFETRQAAQHLEGVLDGGER